MRLAALTALLFIVPVTTAEPIDDRILAPLGSDLAAIRDTLDLPAATWYNDKDGDKVFDSLVRQFEVTGATELPVIVTFARGHDFDAAIAEADRRLGGLDARYEYRNYGGFAADLSLAEVFAIAAMPQVRQVEWSQPGDLELDTATQTMGVDAVQDLLGLDGGDGMADFTGDDSIIAILDTGFHGGHVDLQGKFLHFIDWSEDGAEGEPYDAGTHGTHVASIAGGLGVGDPAYKGVAPGASFVGFLISSSDTKGAAIASIDWILERRETVPVDILTISFGFGITNDGTDALELAMDMAWEAGVTTFKSTGNSGPDRGTVTVPGGARGIIGTASMWDAGEGGFRLSSFSSRGPTADGRLKPDIAAPGSSIMAADANTDDGYVSFSGTSMASPFAAGVAAILKSIDPTLTPDDVRAILIATAEDWGPPGHDIDYGNGRIDALAAVQLVLVAQAAEAGLPFAAVQGWDVERPMIPPHFSGILSGAAAYFDVDVADASQPFSVTVIANESSSSTPLAELYGDVAVVVDPNGNIAATVGFDGAAPSFGVGADPVGLASRQQTVSFMPMMEGLYTVQLVNPLVDEVLVDVGAGVEREQPGLWFLSEEGYQELAGPATGASSESTPGPGLLLSTLFLGLVGLALRRRD